MDDVTNKLKQLWSSSQRNLVLSAVLAAIVAAIIVVALWSSSQSFRPLYSQQERFDIGEIVSVLESEGVSYRMQEQNGQVLVPEGEVARIRMLLASKGVKAKLPTGLDSLKEDSSLGTSQFMETARYRHGLEGELVRTIMSLNSVATRAFTLRFLVKLCLYAKTVKIRLHLSCSNSNLVKTSSQNRLKRSST